MAAATNGAVAWLVTTPERSLRPYGILPLTEPGTISTTVSQPTTDSPRRSPRRSRAPLGCLLLLLGAAFYTGKTVTEYYARLLQPAGAGPEQVFEVRRGDSPTKIAERLASAGLIRDARAFCLRSKQRAVDAKLQAGCYELSPQFGVDGILDRLVKGDVATRKVTIPEGLTIEEAAAKAAAAGFKPAAEYVKLATHPPSDLLPGLAAGETLEGYLFPETYRLPLNATPSDLVRAQVQRFQTVWGELTAGRALQRSRHELVTIASMVEEEARWDDERAKIAGVIENRLAKGQPLEICATVIYALGGHRTKLLERDLRVESLYNTYRHKGLPPGPIASPGKASLAAALAPAKHDWSYYVLGADGRHLFTRTYAEHRRAKQQGERARAEEQQP